MPPHPEVMVSHESLDAAVQSHPTGVVTLTVPVVAAGEVRFDDVGAIVNVHGAPAWVRVNGCPAIVIAPVRELVVVELAVTL